MIAAKNAAARALYAAGTLPKNALMIADASQVGAMRKNQNLVCHFILSLPPYAA